MELLTTLWEIPMKKIGDPTIKSQSPRAIRMQEVQNKTGLSKTHIYRLLKNESGFPKPFKLSERAIAFLESEIDLWIEQRRDGRII